MVVMFFPPSPRWRSGWMLSNSQKECVMKKIALVRVYGRYVISALAALAFGMDPQ